MKKVEARRSAMAQRHHDGDLSAKAEIVLQASRERRTSSSSCVLVHGIFSTTDSWIESNFYFHLGSLHIIQENIHMSHYGSLFISTSTRCHSEAGDVFNKVSSTTI
jgi:hypothetical protein